MRLLAANGGLPAEKIGGRWLVERAGVEHRRSLKSSGGRRFAPRNAWALLDLASGAKAVPVDPPVRSRLRRSVSLEGLGALAQRLERRAEVARFRAHPGEIARVHADRRLVASGVSAARQVGLDVVAGREVDGYVSASVLDQLVVEHGLAPASMSEANIALRIVPGDVWEDFLAGRPHAPAAVVALDLAEEPDPRSQAAGKGLLARLEREAR
ncbi:MAG: hypothetical protein JSS68_00825 [Actinobacteria bacterium]|nr:hypothetical protein [Actinomycetota bacterium]